jgi:hypothetical protein
MTPERMLELSRVFESASQEHPNIIDPPFDCVGINLKPSTWGDLAHALKEMAETYLVAADSRHSSELIGIRVRNRLHSQ